MSIEQTGHRRATRQRQTAGESAQDEKEAGGGSKAARERLLPQEAEGYSEREGPFVAASVELADLRTATAQKKR